MTAIDAMMSEFRTWLIVMALCLPLAAQKPGPPDAQSPLQDNNSGSGFQSRDPRYSVQAGDVMDIVFSFTPEFNQTVSVQPDGYITLRDIGDVKVGGTTVPELTETIKLSYAKILHDPAVSIVLKDFEKPHFVVGGEVNRPGKYELRADTTLMEAIAIAGGFNDRSKHSQVLLFRRASGDWMAAKKVDVKQLAATADFREDIHLRPGDMLFVPQNRISKIKPFLPISAVSALLYKY
jgi:polysaccharide export outer membrane protein